MKFSKGIQAIVDRHNRIADEIMKNDTLSREEKALLAQAMKKIARRNTRRHAVAHNNDDVWYGVKMGFCICSQPTEAAARKHARKTGGRPFVVENGTRRYLD